MYTLLLNANNTVSATNVTGVKIIQNSASNTVQFLSPAVDDEGNDLTDAVMQLEYIYPVSKEYGVKYLMPSSVNYKPNYELQYLLPMDTGMTKEAGNIRFVVTFMKLIETEGDPQLKEYVNKHIEGSIPITEGSKWQMYIPDDLLLPLDQRILKLEAQQALLTGLAGKLETTQPANIALDHERIKLTNDKNEHLGEGLDVHQLSPIIGSDVVGADLDGTIDGVTHLDQLVEE